MNVLVILIHPPRGISVTVTALFGGEGYLFLQCCFKTTVTQEISRLSTKEMVTEETGASQVKAKGLGRGSKAAVLDESPQTSVSGTKTNRCRCPPKGGPKTIMELLRSQSGLSGNDTSNDVFRDCGTTHHIGKSYGSLLRSTSNSLSLMHNPGRRSSKKNNN